MDGPRQLAEPLAKPRPSETSVRSFRAP